MPIIGLVNLFNALSFTVESYYFQRYYSLLKMFEKALRQRDIPCRILADFRQELTGKRAARNEPKGSLPSISKLPLPVLRKLAGQPPYLALFIGHSDHRIALQTYRNINKNIVQKVLRRPEINVHLIQAILKEKAFFTRTPAVKVALLNPKCTVEFAKQYLPRLRTYVLGRQMLERIGHVPNADVRNLVKLAKNSLSMLEMSNRSSDSAKRRKNSNGDDSGGSVSISNP